VLAGLVPGPTSPLGAAGAETLDDRVEGGPRRGAAAIPTAPVTPVASPAAPPRRRQPAQRIETDDLDRLLQIGASRPTAARRWRTALVWLAVLGVLAWAAFLPYPFEVGGEFTVQPLERAEARSRTDGEIIEINVREGDRVEAGDVMAVLSNWDELRDVAVNEADRAKLRAELAALTAGASPEQVEVARRAVATAELRVRSAQRALERDQALFDAGTIPEATLEDSRAAHDLAVANRDEAQAALAVVTAPPRQPQVDSLNAALARNEEELAFSRLLLEYTNIRAPVDGQVVSSLDETPLGAFLATGGLFAELEDNRVVIAEVEVPETTISEVGIGAPAELRLWSDPQTPIEGTVRSVAPRAEERDFGWIIRVQVEVPNPDGHLAANMTGFAKISAAERPAWQAFSRAIERFVVIELWSWVP
jgi:multidrug resistance efflux pump